MGPNSTEKSIHPEVASIRRNKRSTTTSAIVNINVVERELFDLELEKQNLRVQYLSKNTQAARYNAKSTKSTYLDAKIITREQEQNQPSKESLKKQSQSSMKKSPPRKKKSLKDLIYETNKAFYQVDSNKVKYKVGLSKKQLLSSKTEGD